ncbi:NADAR family protein [Insolitispirillum peregrinum]|uniref:NADAR domain-containing protein n=1 Tax=Insolitispirillum peregrinum TaxID=80876 RepID=A0A1N7MQN9_9PROT|nr:NADAR family protein [Insolitispirillum peregrinum]SIS88445.1 hypothetical protein SAMN05421779_104285 [Insolitispirillum peregrinum]
MSETFTFFWSGPFSQWHPCSFSEGDVPYACAEQYMMAKKALLFGDLEIHAQIMAAPTPRKQKALGRKIQGFQAEVWQRVARAIVYQGNYYKFTQDPELRAVLLATAGTTLVEASPEDRIWGIGLAEDNPAALDRSTWQGSNWLGECLTDLRGDLLAIDGRTGTPLQPSLS